LRALRLVSEGELSAEGVRVVPGADGLLAALVCVALPGASGLVWPPQSASNSGREIVEDVLLHDALRWLRDRGAKLAQTLLLPEEAQVAVPLERNGFRHVTGLLYMRHLLGLQADEARADDLPLTYRTYTEPDCAAFRDALMRSYEGTLDCPELNGIRDVEEIIAGHKVQGAYDPQRWWLALLDGLPAGVLLLTQLPDLGVWDVGYLGVVPEARGKGVGRALTLRAIHAARAAGAAELTLAVDVRNLPACNLYTRQGFETFDRREVYLAFLQ
jgi:ribosomal protein S18 acetylase RimI-like enzyme